MIGRALMLSSRIFLSLADHSVEALEFSFPDPFSTEKSRFAIFKPWLVLECIIDEF